jgi:gliding motility-associated-like protein
MKLLSCILLFCIAIIIFPAVSYSQYILHGNAVKESCNCYSLTNNSGNESGSVWQATKIDLSNPFDFSFNVYLGCSDGIGADGIVFILNPYNTQVGTSGYGLGFEGIIPSIGISLDTYQNIPNNDPAYDHISIQANGNIQHGNDLAGPIPVSATSDNVEDCGWHQLRITWDPATKTLSAYFDGVFRLSTQTDIVATIFNNDPLVYWGFSGSTGSLFNNQKFCTPLIPGFNSNASNDTACIGTPLIFKDQSVSYSTIKGYYWDFGDGTTSTDADPPPHNYSSPGTYQVKHVIIAADGCPSDTITKSIQIGDKPIASFNIYDTCKTLAPRIGNNTTVDQGVISQWNWQLDGSDLNLPNTKYPELNNIIAGSHMLQLIATSSLGCSSNSLKKNFIIKDIPEINIITSNGCINTPIPFTAKQTDNLTEINSWHWDFGDDQSSDYKNLNHTYVAKGLYPVRLTVTATNGCAVSSSKNIFINAADAFAGNDTVVVANTPFQLHGSGGDVYRWSPSAGLDNPYISDPAGKLTDDMKYLLTVTTAEGCTDTASVNVKIFKGSNIYVPTGFTPNNDGRNDILKPMYIGIKSVSYFTIYNRWGQKVFSTSDLNKGWDGTLNGRKSETESFAWILKATDLIGKIYFLKGAVTLIR